MKSYYNETVYYCASLGDSKTFKYIVEEPLCNLDSLCQVTTNKKSIFTSFFETFFDVEDFSLNKLNIINNFNYLMSNGQTLLAHLCECDKLNTYGINTLQYLFNISSNDNYKLVKALEQRDKDGNIPVFNLLYNLEKALTLGVNTEIRNNNGKLIKKI